MKLTKDSKKLMMFFNKHKCLPHIKQTKSTNQIFKTLFHELDEAVKYIESVKKQLGDSFYKLKINKIHSVSSIPKPSTFPSDSFPNLVRKHIDSHSLCSLEYSFELIGRPIHIIFLIEESNPEMHIDTYNNYVDHMLAWLYIVNQYASRDCASKLSVFVYHTSLTKELPKNPIEILNQHHVNTAFTFSCPVNSEIVVFRKEEWFKVFMHETFHNFALDFSDMNNNKCHSKILQLFPVKSDVNLYEAYTEFWARIMNVVFCSYFNTRGKKKKNIDQYLVNVETFMNFEIMYSFFQMIKVLHFMNLEYTQLYESGANADNIRKTLYKEDTNVLSYYVITLILIYNFQPFLSWCSKNNTSLLQFKKSESNQMQFCAFIESKYTAPKLLNGIKCASELFKKIKVFKGHSEVIKRPNTKKELEYLYNNLRMTLCELG